MHLLYGFKHFRVFLTNSSRRESVAILWRSHNIALRLGITFETI